MRERTYRYYILRAVAAWLVLLTPVSSLAMSPLRMAFDGDAIVIGGLELGGSEIVFYSVSRYSNGFVPVNRRRAERIVDEDGHGEIRVELERPAPPKFLAVAIELKSGRYDLLTPPGSPAREIALPVTSLIEGPGHRLERLEEAKSYVELLVTRPGSGSWVISTGDGARSDDTPSNDGLVATRISDMLPVGESPPPPQEYETGDLLVRVAPADMEFYVARVVR